MDRHLYVERWLLTLKDACLGAGLQAHVRALDVKGGKRLELEVRQGNDALELCYRKRLTGVRMVVAATCATLVTRIKEVHTRLLNEHRKLLENGFRRFLRRAIRLLEELENAFTRDAGWIGNLARELRALPEAKQATPALLARRLRGLPARYEVRPAAAFLSSTAVRFAAVVDKKLIDLIRMVPGEEQGEMPPASTVAPETPAPTSPRPGGVELVALTGATGAAAVGATVVAQEQARAAAAQQARLDSAAAAAGGGSQGGDALAEGAIEVVGEGLGAVLEGADVVGAAVEGVSTASSCLGDAACSMPDCGGMDFGAVDCGGIDCGGIG